MKNHRLLLFGGLLSCGVALASCSKTKLEPDALITNGESALAKVRGASYFVAVNGNDSNPGTLQAPFRTINKALSVTSAGDVVQVRKGTYAEKVRFTRSGASGNYITLKAYPGEKPVISGEGLSISGYEALVTIENVSWIKMEGLIVRDYKSTVSWASPDGITVKGGSDNIIIKNNEVANIEHNVPLADGRSAHGILIIGNTNDPLNQITVEGNKIHDCNTGYSENLTINGYVDGFTIRNNEIYNGENIGIDAAGGYAANPDPALNYARNGLIAGNTVHHVYHANGPLGEMNGAIGIYVDGARNITIERNRVYETDRGIGIVSETDNFPTEYCIVRSNLVYNCNRTGIYMGGYIGYTGGGTVNCAILNNTLYYNDRILGAFGEIEGEISLRENCRDNQIRNNIVYARPTDIMLHKYTTTGGNNVINNNHYFSTGTAQWIWNGTTYNSFGAWQAAASADAQSVNGTDPLFVNISASQPDLHIRTSSPARNSGVSSANVGTLDIDGQARVAGIIDKGADEVQ
jgi:hypothetical protein